MREISEDDIKEFRTCVYNHAKVFPRIYMPWRNSSTPYHVLVSELMLQQTQVTRVVDYFNSFISRWSDITMLAKAPLSEVLLQWKGLGYYRRARFLHMCAQQICKDYQAIIPCDEKKLLQLSGIGAYTAAAIIVFAYNKPAVMIETNIRRAIIYYFFKNKDSVDEEDVYEVVKYSMDAHQPRLWYWALMDYGSGLAKVIQNPNRKSTQYKKQSSFHGSNRQIRSAILNVLMHHHGKKYFSEQIMIQKVESYLLYQGRNESSNERFYI